MNYDLLSVPGRCHPSSTQLAYLSVLRPASPLPAFPRSGAIQPCISLVLPDIGKQSPENNAKAETEKGQQIQRPHCGKDLPGSQGREDNEMFPNTGLEARPGRAK